MPMDSNADLNLVLNIVTVVLGLAILLFTGLICLFLFRCRRLQIRMLELLSGIEIALTRLEQNQDGNGNNLSELRQMVAALGRKAGGS